MRQVQRPLAGIAATAGAIGVTIAAAGGAFETVPVLSPAVNAVSAGASLLSNSLALPAALESLGVSAATSAAIAPWIAGLGVPAGLWLLGKAKMEIMKSYGASVPEARGIGKFAVPIKEALKTPFQFAWLPFKGTTWAVGKIPKAAAAIVNTLAIKPLSWIGGKVGDVGKGIVKRPLATTVGALFGYLVMPELTGGSALLWAPLMAYAFNKASKSIRGES